MYERERKIDATERQELAAIEAELAAFTPGPGRLDRDRTMFLAGQAAASSQTTPTATKASNRRWAVAFAAMTTLAGCLLMAVVVQQRSIIALRADEPIKTVASPLKQPPAQPDQPTQQPVKKEPATEPPPQRTFVDDSQPRDIERRAFDFSEERLLAWTDSGTLTARSFIARGEPRTTNAANPTPVQDYPKQTYQPSPPPLPYYKLLRQLQAAGI